MTRFSPSRLAALICGPPLIVGLAYVVARPDFRQSEVPVAGSAPRAGPAGTAREPANSADGALLAACQARREALMKQVGSRFASIVHSPFVIAGDVEAAELERQYRETIAPTVRALRVAYFDAPPVEPVLVVLLSDGQAYQSSASLLDGRSRAAFAGYYERGERRIVVNAATGDGTIAHELTHALAHLDFPNMPEWFDEGLASLHESARFRDGGRRIVGTPNWRGRYLASALHEGTLRPLDSLMGSEGVRPGHQGLDYAHARYVCLFLQERGLLEPFYRKFRRTFADDPTGSRTLCALFGSSDLAAIDEEFRAWASSLNSTPAPSP